MKRLFLISVYNIFFLLPLLGQDSLTSTKKSKWALNFIFSGDYDYRFIHQIAEPPANIGGGYIPGNRSGGFSFMGYKTDDQVPKYGWHASALVSYQFTKKYFFQTGFILDNKGYNTKTFASDIQYDKYGQVLSIDTASYKMNYYFIGIPLLINRELALTKRLYCSITFGCNYYYCERDVIINTYGNFKTKIAGAFDAGNEGISITGSIGLTYYTKHNKILSLKPTYNYFLTNWKDPGLGDQVWYYKLQLYSFGVEFGIGFGLGKKK